MLKIESYKLFTPEQLEALARQEGAFGRMIASLECLGVVEKLLGKTNEVSCELRKLYNENNKIFGEKQKIVHESGAIDILLKLI